MSNLVIHFAPEAILLLCTICYFVISNYILGYNVLITSPLQTTMIFCLGYTIIQFLVLRYMWPRAKAFSDDNQISKRSGFAKSWIKSFLVVLSCWFFGHGLCVLFGAAAFSLVEETTTWAILVTCLIAIPAISMMGCDVPALYRVIVCGDHANETERFLYYQSAGTALGSWASAVVIPLDWDRPWQVWPIPCIIGAVAGYALGVVISCVLTVREFKTVKVL